MSAADHIVYVVDDDFRMREALQDLLTSAHLNVETFSCPADFIGAAKPDVPTCLLLALKLPDINCLDLQPPMASQKQQHIAFITGNPAVTTSTRQFNAG